jgi:hypothetical protein
MSEPDPRDRDLAALIDEGSNDQSLPLRICLASVRAVPVTGAAISVMTGAGQLTTVCASDDAAARLEEMQFTLGIGPCVDAVRSGGPVLVRDLADDADPVGVRWLGFAGPAVAAGVRAVFAFPLIIGAITLGALDLYRDTAGLLDAGELRQALLIADAAAIALLGPRDVTSSGTADELGDAPIGGGEFHLAEVYQATGMIMIQLGGNVADALARLRAHAFASDRSIGQVAREVVARRLRFDAENQ